MVWAWLVALWIDGAIGATPHGVGAWGWLIGVGVAGLLAGMAGVGAVKAGLRTDAEGRPGVYTLSLGEETIELTPGKAWIQADHFKWATRGLIEEPQSYHVLPNGTVEINGEKIALGDAEGTAKLEREINKHHAVAVPARRTTAVRPDPEKPPPSDRVQFHVKLDHLGHLTVECLHAGERTETGLRGLPGLVVNGLMVKPRLLHVDPLQRWVELDGHRFECTEAGAHAFQALLNAEYAPKVRGPDDHVIEVRENPASSTGFDLHFVTFRAGARLEVKGHLAQDKLDLLQDYARCDLLVHGTILRLSPPYLLIRRKRPDGGEERIPGMDDVPYRRVTAAQLQEVLNHPLIKKGGVAPAAAAVQPAPPPPPPSPAAAPPAIASAAPPPANPLSALEPARPAQVAAAVPSARPEGALPAPPRPAPTPEALPATSAAEPGALLDTSRAEDSRLARAELLFAEKDPGHVNGKVFERLCVRLGLPIQSVRLSVPRVFEHRRFDVLSFNQEEVTDITDLRSDTFYGFYLSHLDAGQVILVYACRGRHVEWGPHKCVLQVSVTAEAEEFAGAALRGLLQDKDDFFVFVVSAAYKQWVGPREAEFQRVCVRFVTADEAIGQSEHITFIWPEPAQGGCGE